MENGKDSKIFAGEKQGAETKDNCKIFTRK